MRLNIYAIINGINSLFSLAIFVIILLKKSKTSLQKTYAFWMLMLFGWAMSYFVWGLQTTNTSSVIWLQILLYPVCLIHVAYFHSSLAFSDSVQKYKKYLIVAYILSGLCVIVNFYGGFIDAANVRFKYGFLWPHGTRLLLFLIVNQIYFILLSLFILNKLSAQANSSTKLRLKIFLISGAIAWLGGMMNWFPWFDLVSIPPAGNIGVTFFMLISTYLILKYDLLQLNLVIRKTFVYASLTLFITLVYTLFILLSEKISQTYFGYNSFLATLLAALTIALLFNPLRAFLTKITDKIFFGKSITELSIENTHMKSELQKQDQMKAVATLATGMAHEIKNPLTALKTFAEYLPEKSSDPEFLVKFQRIVKNEVEKIDSIVRQLLDFSKPTPPELNKLLVREPIEETLEFLNNDLLKHNIHAEKHLDDAEIMGDKKQLKQVFLNIFLNAIDAMPSGGALKISSSHHLGKNNVIISISDTGQGITKEDLPHLFDPFFTKKPDGTGLGLSIARGIIEEHKGKIEASSRVGSGTEFRIYLQCI